MPTSVPNSPREYFLLVALDFSSPERKPEHRHKLWTFRDPENLPWVSCCGFLAVSTGMWKPDLWSLGRFCTFSVLEKMDLRIPISSKVHLAPEQIAMSLSPVVNDPIGVLRSHRQVLLQVMKQPESSSVFRVHQYQLLTCPLPPWYKGWVLTCSFLFNKYLYDAEYVARVSYSLSLYYKHLCTLLP